jgi:hypothetical protein
MLSELEEMLKPGFEADPVFPGSLHRSRHRCGKAECSCQEGRLHEALRLQIRFKDGLANRCLSEEEAAIWRPRTEAYRRIRKAGRAFSKWQREVASLLDALERARRSSEGLGEECLVAVDVEGDNVRVATAYRPDAGEWRDDLKTRRPKQ